MLSEEIRSIHAALGVLAGRVTEEDWALVSLARNNLAACVEQADDLENRAALAQAAEAV